MDSNIQTFGVNSSSHVKGVVRTTIPPGATRDVSLSRNLYGFGKRQTKLAARTHPNCPRSEGRLQASPHWKDTLLLSYKNKILGNAMERFQGILYTVLTLVIGEGVWKEA